MRLAVLLLAGLSCSLRAMAQAQTSDPYLWLEDVSGDRSLAWAREQNTRTQQALSATPEFAALRTRLLQSLDAVDRIPFVSQHGGWCYNFWRDAQHPRGLLRRTTLADYRNAQPAWETILDLDALAAREKENWVWQGESWLRPTYDRCLIQLSRGGSDAVVVREFDVEAKAFVTDGFFLPEAKSRVSWRDRDTLYVGTDFGPGSLTTSGYPRLAREWRRGTPLSAARPVFEGQAADVSVSAAATREPGFNREFVVRTITFYTSERFLRTGERWTKLDLPADAAMSTFREHLFVTLRSPWTVGGATYPTGALLVIRWDAFLAGQRTFTTLFTPTPRSSLAGFTFLRGHIIVNELANVRNRLHVLTPQADGSWSRAPLPAPEFGTTSVAAVDEETNDYFLTATDFLTPTRLALGTVGRTGTEELKRSPAYFQAAGLEISQHEALSADGTRVPYFQVARAGAPRDGTNPTVLYGYGGFRLSQVPAYAASTGIAWLERGGVYVLANIRGGGEFGPAWHQAALKENRQRAYDDFAAVAEDLIARNVTSPRHLGIMGGSNGGLLVAAVMAQRPELFNAVVCRAPLLDMRRYHRLLAGASWMGEYGDPDVPEQWAYIRRYSPYQNVTADKRYPRVLFTTSTRDDRVHPGHARKLAALMQAQKHDVLYYENIEGGHAGAADNPQQAFMSALAYTFLWRQLK